MYLALQWLELWQKNRNIACLSFLAGVITEAELPNSDPEAQGSLPDIPYEQDLDIEVDFPRG